MSIESIPDDILQIILEKVDIYTTLTSLPLVCTRFSKLIRGVRRPFKWAIRCKHINRYNYVADFYPSIVQMSDNDEFYVAIRGLDVTHVYAEDLNLSNYTYIIFGKGYDHELKNSVHFMYICPILFHQNAPILDLHGTESSFFVKNINLRTLLKDIHNYKRFFNHPLETFIREKFIHTNEHYNSFNNITLTNYKNVKLIKQVYS